MSKDMSHKEFLNKLSKTNTYFNNKEFEIVNEYINYDTPLIVKDSWGLLHSMRSYTLFKGSKPIFQTALNKGKYLELELKNLNKGFKEGYLHITKDFEYVSQKVHVENKYGTMLCNIHLLRKGQVPTIETAINKESYFSNVLKEKNLEIYNQVKVKKYLNSTKVVLETKYGDVAGDVKSILSWENIGILSAIDKTDFWIRRAKDLILDYDNTDHSLVRYKDNKTKITLKCKKHDIEYKQTPCHYMEGGKSCPKCIQSTLMYTESNVVKNKDFLSSINGYFYVLRLKNNEENFVKVGICAQHRLEYRLTPIRRIYDVELLYKKEMNMVEAFNMEQKILKEFKNNFKYIPKIKFKGYTECLTENPLNYIYGESNN